MMVHSDRGSQYTSKAYCRLLKANGLPGGQHESKRELLRQYGCREFFASLKKERVQWKHYQTRAEAQQDILGYITMFYISYQLY